MLHSCHLVFSSPELKAQVSFSDHLSSVFYLSVCKLFTFSSSSPEPLGQFQPNLAQGILEWRGFKFDQMKGPALFQGKIIMKWWKYIDENKKSSSPEPLGQFQPNLAQSILGWRGFKFVQMKGPALFQGEIITKAWNYIYEILKIFFSRTNEPISTNLGTNHSWMKGIQVSSNEEKVILIKLIMFFFLFFINVII